MRRYSFRELLLFSILVGLVVTWFSHSSDACTIVDGKEEL